MGTPNITGQGQPTLNRWLNINAPVRNSRVRGYLSLATDLLPALSGPIVWNGYSEKVCQVNVTTPNNYSVVQEFADDVATLVGSPTQFLWTVTAFDASRDKFGVFGLRRYRINEPTSIYTIITDGHYTGQVLGYYTAFEAWTTNPNTQGRIAATIAAQQILTSVLSATVDLRSGANFQLSTYSAGHEDFNNTSVSSVGSFDLPLTFPDYVADYSQ